MKKQLLSILLMSSTFAFAQNVNIPDANFKAYLVGESSINTNSDSEIQLSEAQAFTGTISCSNLNITDLTGIEAFTSLDRLWCWSNQITSIDASQNTALTSLSCWGNQLTSLNVANGNNTNFTAFDAQTNPNLTCIEVDDDVWSTTNWTNIDAASSFSTDCSACIVNIPDVNFKYQLVNNAGINTNGDSEIQCAEAQAWTGQIVVYSQGIHDLTGIEAFPNITSLNCQNNYISDLDLSSNLALASVNCGYNQITSLTLGANTVVNNLSCLSNDLTALDLSSNTGLTNINCSLNQLVSLNVTGINGLDKLTCTDNEDLASLDLTSNFALTDLNLDGCITISSIDVTNCFGLEYLNITDTDIASIDLVNNGALIALQANYCPSLNSLNLKFNTSLETLGVVQTAIANLDLSFNSSLVSLQCGVNNQLTELLVDNGNNQNMVLFAANSTPNLSCIQVDDANYSATNWTNIDSHHTFSEDCSGTVSINENDENLTIYPNPVTDILNISADQTVQQVEVYALSGKLVLRIANPNTSINLSELSKGIYTLKIRTSNGVHTSQLVKS